MASVRPLMNRWSWLFRAAAFTGVVAAGTVSAATLTVTVTDSAGKPVADAAVYVEGGQARSAPANLREVSIEQASRKFGTLVTVIQTGTAIHFPNNDTTRHHVYSFSPAKPFELKLYAGTPANPIVFDKPGSVVLGCNIHDQMIAYVQVVDTPWFGKTDAAGRAVIAGVPGGSAYRLRTWHFDLPNPGVAAEQPLAIAGEAAQAHVKLDLSGGAGAKP